MSNRRCEWCKRQIPHGSAFCGPACKLAYRRNGPRKHRDITSDKEAQALEPLHRLGLKPTGLDAPLLSSQVDEHRRVDCRMYELCLNAAIAADWQSFSCSKCEGYQSAPLVKPVPVVGHA